MKNGLVMILMSTVLGAGIAFAAEKNASTANVRKPASSAKCGSEAYDAQLAVQVASADHENCKAVGPGQIQDSANYFKSYKVGVKCEDVASVITYSVESNLVMLQGNDGTVKKESCSKTITPTGFASPGESR